MISSTSGHTARRPPTDLEVARAIHHNEGLREPERDPDADSDAFIAALIADEQPADEISIIDRMIDDNSRDAAAAKSEAARRGYKENIELLETERDRLIAAAKDDPQPHGATR